MQSSSIFFNVSLKVRFRNSNWVPIGVECSSDKGMGMLKSAGNTDTREAFMIMVTFYLLQSIFSGFPRCEATVVQDKTSGRFISYRCIVCPLSFFLTLILFLFLFSTHTLSVCLPLSLSYTRTNTYTYTHKAYHDILSDGYCHAKDCWSHGN